MDGKYQNYIILKVNTQRKRLNKRQYIETVATVAAARRKNVLIVLI